MKAYFMPAYQIILTDSSRVFVMSTRISEAFTEKLHSITDATKHRKKPDWNNINTKSLRKISKS